MFNIFHRKRLTRTTPRAAVNEVIVNHVAPLLKAEGFRKNGTTWLKNNGEYSFVINVQSSRWNSKDTGASFTINYGIFVPSIFEKTFHNPAPSEPKEYDCTYRHSVGKKKGRDIWWEIYDYTDTEKLGREACKLIVTQPLRLFSSIKGLSDIEQILKNKKVSDDFNV